MKKLWSILILGIGILSMHKLSAQVSSSFNIGTQFKILPMEWTTIDLVGGDSGDISTATVKTENTKMYTMKVFMDFSVVEHLSSSLAVTFWPGSDKKTITDTSNTTNSGSIANNFFILAIENRYFLSANNMGPYLGLSGYTFCSAMSYSTKGTTVFTDAVKAIRNQVKLDSYSGITIDVGYKIPLISGAFCMDIEGSFDPFNLTGNFSAGLEIGIGKTRY